MQLKYEVTIKLIEWFKIKSIVFYDNTNKC